MAPQVRLYCCRQPRADERSIFRLLQEIYDPQVLLFKLFPTIFLRICKTLALVFNEGLGRALCGWKQGESRLLDFIGAQTGGMCWQLYKKEITEPVVHDFLRRRFLFCIITTTGTALQLMLQLVADAPEYAVIITILLAPLTIVDRQFATLVTKMTPRFERAMMLRMVGFLFAALRDGPYPTLEQPKRYSMYKVPEFNLTHLEMLCGFTQFVCGVIVFLYTILLLMDAQHGEVGLYFDMGDGRCDGSAWTGTLLCYHPDVLITLCRIAKELTNWGSPWIEWRLTPLKYSRLHKVLPWM